VRDYWYIQSLVVAVAKIYEGSFSLVNAFVNSLLWQPLDYWYKKLGYVREKEKLN